ncbi:MAG: hypothetical protein AAFQ51_13045 [Pseudomonadota bacterium]
MGEFNIFALLVGILLGLAIMVVPFLWSVYRIAVAGGWTRWAHVAACLLTIAGAATISWVVPGPAILVGGLLVLAGIYLILKERSWNKLFPLGQVAFGLALVASLPFG